MLYALHISIKVRHDKLCYWELIGAERGQLQEGQRASFCASSPSLPLHGGASEHVCV